MTLRTQAGPRREQTGPSSALGKREVHPPPAPYLYPGAITAGWAPLTLRAHPGAGPSWCTVRVQEVGAERRDAGNPS